MESGGELFRKFLNREPLSRPAFVPMLRGLLSRVEGTPLEKLTSDPTLWANSLLKTAKLFGFDGVVAGLDFSLMAEACGCDITWKNDRPLVMPPKGSLSATPEQNGRMRHALEAAKRLFEVCRINFACVAALTGPVTLARQLFGKDEGPNRIREVKQLVVQTAEAFCKTRPDVLIFLEGRPLALAEPEAIHRRVYNTLKNIADYYDIPVGLYLQGYDPLKLKQFSSLKMDVYIPGPAWDNHLPPLSELLALGEDAVGVGLGLPLDDFEKAREIIREGLQLYHARARQSFFFTSFGPTTRDVNLESLHEIVAEICNL
jgi:hypothetical protein